MTVRTLDPKGSGFGEGPTLIARTLDLEGGGV